MKTFIFSDVHGNRFGLEAVLAYTNGHYDNALCLGDVVGYGAHPNECCELVRETIAASPHGACLLGNHDAAALGIIDASWFNDVAFQAITWTGDELSEENKAWLHSLRATFSSADVGLADIPFEAVHGSLREPLEEYITEPTIAYHTVKLMTTELCFYGHTHVARAWALGESKRGLFRRTPNLQQADLREGGLVSLEAGVKVLLNPGSCGQPRDGNSKARAAIWDSEAATIEVFQVDYDCEAARVAIYEAGLPGVLGDRLMIGR